MQDDCQWDEDEEEEEEEDEKANTVVLNKDGEIENDKKLATAHDDSDEEICMKCGFYTAMTEICYTTKLPHKPQKDGTKPPNPVVEQKEEKEELATTKEDIKEEHPATTPSESGKQEAKPNSDDDSDEEICMKCGFYTAMTEICFITKLPHKPKEEAEEGEPPSPLKAETPSKQEKEEDSDEEICMKCGFYTAMTEICFITKLPHKIVKTQPEEAPTMEESEDDEEEEEEECPKCGFSLSMVATCPETQLPHVAQSEKTLKEAAEICEKQPSDEEDEDEEEEEDCSACGFSISMSATCPATSLPHVSKTAPAGKQQETNDKNPAEPEICFACGEGMDAVVMCQMTGLPHRKQDQEEDDDGGEDLVVGPWEKLRKRVPKRDRDWKRTVDRDPKTEWKEKIKTQMDRKGLPPLVPPKAKQEAPPSPPPPAATFTDEDIVSIPSEANESFPNTFSLSTCNPVEDADPSISEFSELDSVPIPDIFPSLLQLPPPASPTDCSREEPEPHDTPEDVFVSRLPRRSLSPIPTLTPVPRPPLTPETDAVDYHDLMDKATDVRDACSVVLASLEDSPNHYASSSPQPIFYIEPGSLVRKAAMEWLLDVKCVSKGDSYSESTHNSSDDKPVEAEEATHDTAEEEEGEVEDKEEEPASPEPALPVSRPSPWVDLSKLLVNVCYDGGAQEREASYSRREELVAVIADGKKEEIELEDEEPEETQVPESKKPEPEPELEPEPKPISEEVKEEPTPPPSPKLPCDACVGTSPIEVVLTDATATPETSSVVLEAPDEHVAQPAALVLGSYGYLATAGFEAPNVSGHPTASPPMQPYLPPSAPSAHATWDYMPVRVQHYTDPPLLDPPASRRLPSSSVLEMTSIPIPKTSPAPASFAVTLNERACKETETMQYLPIQNRPVEVSRPSPPLADVDESVWKYETIPMTPAGGHVQQTQSSPVHVEENEVEKVSAVSPVPAVGYDVMPSPRRVDTVTPAGSHASMQVQPTSAGYVSSAPTHSPLGTCSAASSLPCLAPKQSPSQALPFVLPSLPCVVPPKRASAPRSEETKSEPHSEENTKTEISCLPSEKKTDENGMVWDTEEEEVWVDGSCVTASEKGDEVKQNEEQEVPSPSAIKRDDNFGSFSFNATFETTVDTPTGESEEAPFAAPETRMEAQSIESKNIEKESTASPAAEDDEICMKCGFYTAMTEICFITKLPHKQSALPVPIEARPLQEGGEPELSTVQSEHEESQTSKDITTADKVDQESLTNSVREEAPEQAFWQEDEDKKDGEPACGYSINVTETCPETSLPHKASATHSNGDDVKKTASIGTQDSSVTGADGPEQKEEPSPSVAADDHEDEICMKCGFYTAMTEICYTTKLPHKPQKDDAVESPVQQKEDTKKELAMTEICNTAKLPHESSTSEPPNPVDEQKEEKEEPATTKEDIKEEHPATTPSESGKQEAKPNSDDDSDEEICMKCGFYTAMTEICFITKLPHKPKEEAEEGEPPSPLKAETPSKQEKEEDSDEEICMKCGFYTAMTEICFITKLPHKGQENTPELRKSAVEQKEVKEDTVETPGSLEEPEADSPSDNAHEAESSKQSKPASKNRKPESSELSEKQNQDAPEVAGEDTGFAVGDRVSAHGLTKHPLINGTTGRVIGFQESKDATLIQVEFPAGCVAVRDVHLITVDVKMQEERLQMRRQSSTPPVLPGVTPGLRRQNMAQAPDAGISIAAAIKEWERSTVNNPEQPVQNSEVEEADESDGDDDPLLLLKVQALSEAHDVPWTLATKRQVAKKLTRFRATIRAVAGGWAVCKLADGFVTGKGMYYTIATSEPSMPPGYKIICRKTEPVKELSVTPSPTPPTAALQPRTRADSRKRSVFRDRGRSVMTATENEESMFTTGRHVIAEGLKKAPHINKQRGKILGKQKQPGGEILIQVDFSGQCMAVREANLRPVCCNEICGKFPSTKCGKCGLNYCSSCTCPCSIDPTTRAVDWVKDEASTVCSGCGSLFTTLRRRHHCRACGHLFCASCVRTRQILPGFDTPQKVCQTCTVDISPTSNNWLPDSEANECGLCWGIFSKKKRRHHCRACGKIFCDPCSSQRMRVQGYVIPQRVCIRCAAAKQDQEQGLPLNKPTRGIPEGYEGVEVRVTVHAALRLPRVEFKSALDVFVKMRCKTNKDKWVGDEVSWPVVSALEPVYNTTRLLRCTMEEVSTVEFRLWDKGIGQDEFIGDVTTPLSTLTPGKQLQLPIRCKAKGAVLIVSFPSEPPTLKNVILVRHGQSRWNAAKAAGGKAGVVDRLKETDHPLSAMGKDQATQLCVNIEDAIREDTDVGKLLKEVEICYASPLTRAVQTALIGVNTVTRSTKKKLILTRYAREKRNVGGRDTNGAVKGSNITKRVQQETDKLYEGVVPNTIDYESVEHFRVNFRWWNDKAESKEEFLYRLADLLNLIQWSPYKDIMIVGHSHCFRGFVNRYMSPSATLPHGVTHSDLQHKKLCNCGAMHIVMDFSKPTPIESVSLILGTTLVGGKAKVTDSDDEQ